MEKNIIDEFKTLVELEEFRKEINEACDRRAEYIKLCESAFNLTEKNFGYIKESFENLASELFKTTTGKKLINKYKNTIKENKNLSSLHSIYENVRKANVDTDINFFADTLSNTDWNIDRKTIKEDVKSLGMVLAEAYLYLGDNADLKSVCENKKLYEAIEFVAANKKSAKNITEYSNAIKLIKEDVSSRKVLSEEERTFKDKKDACLNGLKEAIENSDDESKGRLSAVMEQLSKKAYSKDTFEDDMQKLSEIEQLF